MSFLSTVREEWMAIFDAADACFTPVLSMAQTLVHPHNQARQTYIQVGGVDQPAPAPRYSATVCSPPRAPAPARADVDAFLRTLTADRSS